MAFLNKNYTFSKQENFDGFLKAVGIPDDKIAKLQNFAPDQKIVQDGDSYVIHTAGPEGPKQIKFQSGVEFDDVIGTDKTPIKTKYTVDGNTVIQNISSDKGSAVFKREFVGDDLIVTITSDKWDGVAKRYYKAA
uniref:Cytosolic fatty-acid binding proteins domain-containing protein n=1 Tax=Heliothis virescens TaxID=7102 RepID=A0A2A4IXI1_HELVI